MTPDTFQQTCQQELAALDAQLARVNREVASLAAARPADPDVIAAGVARAQQAVESLGAVVAKVAEQAGEPLPVWDSLAELDATVARLADRLRTAAADSHRTRLRDVAACLLAARVIHPRWQKVIPALDTLRVQAAAAVQEAADSAEPPELPGPADGWGWLAWAWDLPADRVETALAGVPGAGGGRGVGGGGVSPAVGGPRTPPPALAPGPAVSPPPPVGVGGRRAQLVGVRGEADRASDAPSPHPVRPEDGTNHPLPQGERVEDASPEPEFEVPDAFPIEESDTVPDAVPVSEVVSPPAGEPKPEVEAVRPSDSWLDEKLRTAPAPEIEPAPEAAYSPPPPPFRPVPKVVITPKLVNLIGTPPPVGAREPEPEPPVAEAAPAPEPEAVPEAEAEPEPAAPTVTLPEAKIAAAATAVWQLLADDRAGLAAHLSDVVRRADPEAASPPGYLLRAIALSPCLREQIGEIAPLLDEQYSHAFERDCFRGDERWDRLSRLLLAAACLRSALLAPNLGGARILKALRFDSAHQSLYHLCMAACEFADGRVPLDLHALKRTQDKASWDKERSDHASTVRKWIGEVKNKTFKFAAASDVWRDWVTQGDGPVKKALDPALDAKFGELPRAKQDSTLAMVTHRITELENPAWVQRTVNAGRLTPIVGDPITNIQKLSHDAAQHARKWVQLEQRRPVTNPDDERVRRAGRFRQQLNHLRAAAENDLDKTFVVDGSLAARAAVRACRNAIADVAGLFEDVKLTSEEGCAWRVLHADLLRIGAAEVNEAGELPPVPDEQVEPLVDAVTASAASLPSWGDAFRARAEARDYLSAGLILDRAELLDLPPDLVADLTRRRASGLEESRSALRIDLKTARDAVEQAVAFGVIKEGQRNDLLAVVRGVEGRLGLTLRFRPEHAALAGVRAALREHGRAKVEEARRRVAASLPAGHSGVIRIGKVLEKGDVFTANEYLDMASRGIKIPDDAPAFDPLLDFFDKDHGKARPLERFFQSNYMPGYIRSLRTPAAVCGINLPGVEGKHRFQALTMVEAWAEASARKSATEGELKKILAGLGFSVTQLSAAGFPAGRNRERYEVRAEVIRDRGLCPLSVFGSDANGVYRLLCVWNSPTEQELIAMVTAMPAGPVLIFHFGWMTDQRRRDLARLRVTHRRPFLIVDDLLIAYLCGEAGARLPAFIRCAMPLAHSDPYHVTASLVQPEMFYGRRRERDEILSPTGSCFIYGGRQLGKTALLRDAEREFNRTAGQVAMWLDLKDARVGYGKDLWQFLLDQLKKREIVPASAPVNIGPETLLDHVENWLKGDPARRVVLLLDEADQFLVQDSDGGEMGPAGAYARVTKLKGLMDRTNRRFKVVFAGLHNVQRTTRLENHPLAHYGEPICIGPLLDNGEWREAQALVEEPFGALGYRFASRDLVMRILSHTNYYPSLIQLYCNHLLRHVSAAGRQMFDPKASPPYVVTEEHVDEAYQNEELRKAIRDRFTWTLQLDQRYEVLANVIAYHALVEDPHGGATGLTVAEARGRAVGYWPDGFRDGTEANARTLSEQAVQALLDEMVGLGVLRKAGGRYALRNPNVLLLMGTEAEIEDALLVPREPALDQISPAHFRSPLYDGDGHVAPDRRSPLSQTQEAELRRAAYQVTVLFGAAASGLGDVRVAAEQAFGKALFRAPAVAGREGFDEALKKLKARDEGTTLLLVDHSCGWAPEWVRDAIDKAEDAVSEKKYVHILFTADPALARTLTADPKTLADLRGRGVRVTGLEPWHDAAVRQWLEDGSFGPTDKAGRAELRAATGNWPRPLADFHRACQKKGGAKDHLTAFRHELTSDGRRTELLKAFGLDGDGVAGPLTELARCDTASEELLAMDWDAKLGAGGTAAVLRWAEVLRLADIGDEGWRLDPFVAALLLGK